MLSTHDVGKSTSAVQNGTSKLASRVGAEDGQYNGTRDARAGYTYHLSGHDSSLLAVRGPQDDCGIALAPQPFGE